VLSRKFAEYINELREGMRNNALRGYTVCWKSQESRFLVAVLLGMTMIMIKNFGDIVPDGRS
jgi:hypothetical protein